MPIIPESSLELPPKQDSASTSEDQAKSGKENEEFSASDFRSKGPQIADEMPPKVPKEEIEARKKELNAGK